MNTKFLLATGAIVLIAIISFALFTRSTNDSVSESLLADYTEVAHYDSDEVFLDVSVIGSGEAITVSNNAEIIARTDLTIDGALGCADGSLKLIAEGALTINDTIVCQSSSKQGGDITIVAKGGLTMSPHSRIVATGNVQIVDNEASVRDDGRLAVLYDEVAMVPDEGIVIGPFVDEEEEGEEGAGADDASASSAPASTDVPATEASGEDVDQPVTPEPEPEPISFLRTLIPSAHAQVNNRTTTVNLTAEPIVVSGKIKVETPKWKWVKRIVVFDFPNTPSVTIQDFELEGPDGRAGDADSGSCDVKGKNGEDAFRFNAYAPNLTVNNFTLTLGDGGEGGEATTGDGCEEAKAKGGDGGKPGNFRMIGSQNFSITGAFIIHPGDGGAGGSAIAKGKEGDPGQKGGDASAIGGKGADNKKRLNVSGTVAGTGNVQFGDAVGGVGGSALAEGGKGGDADTCGETGGAGGNATAKSGDGGDAKLSVSGGAGRMNFASDIGGQGGIVEAYGGVGGAGGSCDETAKGGDGGKGGDATAREGKGGLGKNGRASDGAALGGDGGNGGKGGDGCTEGIGGDGGSGNIEDGQKGEDGKNLCLSITKEEDYVSLLPGEIQVIKYKDYYIPISNLSRFTDPDGNECDGEEHWHPGPNGAINLRGMAVPDPDPNNCGFGKTSEVPILVVDDPNYTEDSSADGSQNTEGRDGNFDDGGEGQGGGRMIQIEPPTLVIPVN